MKALLLLVSLTSIAAADPKLDSLVGTWQGTGNFTLKGKTMKFPMTYTCAKAGAAVTCSATAQLTKDMSLDERHLFGFDQATGTYHLFSVNDWGEAYDHASKWTDAGKVSFEYTSGNAHEVYAMTIGKDTLGFRGTFTRDGKIVGDGSYELKRQ